MSIFIQQNCCANRYTGLSIMKNFNVTLTGFGGQSIDTNEVIQTQVIIDDESYDVTMHVVPSDAMQADVILGNEFLLDFDLVINQESVKINKASIRNPILNISINESKNEVGLKHILNTVIKTQVENLVKKYKAEATKTIDLEMKINLKDETPISSNPPYAERDIIDNQVENWVKDGIVEPCFSEFSSQVVLVKKKDGSP